MRTSPLLVLGLLVPAVALALEISPATFYSDVRPSSPDAAGINLLTRAGAVQGVVVGRFAPSRPVNRAEFLKMALLSMPTDKRPALLPGDCFPDVHTEDWFSAYVCSAKNAGIVSGHADASVPSDQWLFDPASTVQYDAALKILTRLYAYEIPSDMGADWGEPYYRAAATRGTDLPITIDFATLLSRGRTARLIGAFLAESTGQQQEYRLAEAGKYGTSSSPSSSSSSASSVSSTPSSSSFSSSSSVSSVATSLYTLPSVSHFLLVGKTSDAIADFFVPSNTEPAEVSLARVTLTREARSIDHLELRTASGTLVAVLQQRTINDTVEYKQIFESSTIIPGTFVLPAGAQTHLVIVAVIRSTLNNGFADDLVQVRSVAITLRTVTTNQSVNIPFLGPFPKHQTSLGRISTVTSTSPATGVLRGGTGQVLLSFRVSGSGVEAYTPSLTQMTFSVLRTGQASLSSVLLRSSEASVPCTVNNQGNTISCTGLNSVPGAFSLSSPRTLTLTADILLPTGSVGGRVQATLADPGSPELLGGIQWTDGSTEYRWMEGPTPLAIGTDLRQ